MKLNINLWLIFLFSDCAVCEPALQSKDEEAAERLWKLSEEMTKKS